MFGIGFPEFILIMVLALIVVGPEKLPDLAKSLAKQLLELKKTANSLKDSLQEELKEAERAAEESDKSQNPPAGSLPPGDESSAKKNSGERDTVIDVEHRSAEDVYKEAVTAVSQQDETPQSGQAEKKNQ